MSYRRLNHVHAVLPHMFDKVEDLHLVGEFCLLQERVQGYKSTRPTNTSAKANNQNTRVYHINANIIPGKFRKLQWC